MGPSPVYTMKSNKMRKEQQLKFSYCCHFLVHTVHDRRQNVSEGFSGASLRYGYQVPSLENCGQPLRLDQRRHLELFTHLLDA